MQERTSLEDALSGIGKVERELEDNIGMIELGEAENDAGVVGEAEAALKELKKDVARRELRIDTRTNAWRHEMFGARRVARRTSRRVARRR